MLCSSGSWISTTELIVAPNELSIPVREDANSMGCLTFALSLHHTNSITF